MRTWFIWFLDWVRCAVLLIRVVPRTVRFSGACLCLYYILNMWLGLFGDLLSVWASFWWFCIFDLRPASGVSIVIFYQEFFRMLFHGLLFLLERLLNRFLQCSLISIRTFMWSCISSRFLLLILAYSASDVQLLFNCKIILFFFRTYNRSIDIIYCLRERLLEFRLQLLLRVC